MLARNSQPRPRPGRYTPTQVERVCAYLLSKQLQFERSAADLFPVSWLRFKNTDHGTAINYFGTVKDVDKYLYPYPTAKEWLSCYLSQIHQGVNATDISLLPLVLVQHNRRHFNTLIVTGNEDEAGRITLKIYIIEPKSHNEYNKFKIFPGEYPVKLLIDSLIDALKSSLLPISADICQLRLGVQGVFNSTDCGAHHINVAEAVSSMSPTTLDHTTGLLAQLQATQLSKRNNDGMILDSLNAYEDIISICTNISDMPSWKQLTPQLNSR